MKYDDLGLVNTNNMFMDAIARKYAIPAFNFYNMETLNAIISAARETRSPVILAVSESAINYMTPNILMGMISGLGLSSSEKIALHLDHGSSIQSCIQAIDMGFSSVMIDASKLPFAENIELSRQVAEYAHANNVSVEAELGTLSGIEDENTFGTDSSYTNPDDVIKFVQATNIDSLAIAIGTSHGAYKRKSETEELRFDILAEIEKQLPKFPLVLHGASSIPSQYVKTINMFGGDIQGAMGIAPEQLRKATKMNICKINVDSDSRMAFTAGIRKSLATNPANFNPREYLGAGMQDIKANCIDEIKNIMGSDNKI